MADLTFDPNEYARNVYVAKTATGFQEGQKNAADLAYENMQRELLQQNYAQEAIKFPLAMAKGVQEAQTTALKNQIIQQGIDAENRKLAAQQEYISGMGAGLPEYAQTAGGAGYLPVKQAPAGAQQPAGATGFAPGGLGAYTAVPTRPTDYTARMLQVEGGGRNPMSSAQGPGQFIDSTFVQTFRKTFPDASTGMTDKQILAQRGTGVETAMLKKFTEDNQAVLASRGFAPTNANTYLAHFLGAGGATKVLSAAPNTPIAQVVDAAAIAANPSVFRNIRTAGDMQQWAAGKMGEAGPGITTSAAGVPMTTAAPGSISPFSGGLPIQERPIAGALAGLFGGQQPAPTPTVGAVAPGIPTVPVQPVVGMDFLSPTPMGAPTGLTEPTTPASVVAPIVEGKPGQPVPPPTASSYLRNAPKITGDMQIVVAQDKELERLQKYMAQSGDIAGAAETGLKRIQLRNTFSNLQGLQAITNFDLGDNVSLSSAMSRSTGRKVGVQPLSNGNFNILVDGKVSRANVSRADVKDAAQYMLSESYRAQTMDMQKKQYDLQIELIKERAKTTGKLQEKQLDKLYEGVTKLQVERLKLSGFKVVEGEEGKFFIYKQDGSYAAYVDPEGKVRMPDGTEVSNTSVTQVPLIVPMSPTGR